MASTKFLAIVFMVFQGIVHQSDAALSFSSASTGSIAENTAPGTQIIQVEATGGTPSYSYTISTTPAGLSGWVVLADTDKLRIATGATIDYEDATLVTASYDLTITITATDSAGTPDTGTQTFTLSVTNVDEQPEFTLTSLVANLNTAPAATTLVTLAAVDPEGDSLTYALAATNDAHVQIAGAVISVKAGVTLADCAKIMAVTVKDPANDAVAAYAVACIGSCMASCDSNGVGDRSGVGAITGNDLGLVTTLGVLMILYECFY